MSSAAAGHLTHSEIYQQPELWPDTAERVKRETGDGALFPPDLACVLTGAGSSAYAARAIEAAFPGGRAVPSTDLLIDAHDVGPEGVLISLARSGDSPESVGVIRRIQRLVPRVRHVAITCNAEGQLARFAGVTAIVLDPRTNDRSLVMTSSFSNMVLAGLCLRHSSEIAEALPTLASRVRQNLSALNSMAQDIANVPVSRAVILSSAPMTGWAQEAALKIVEMTAGKIAALAESFLGLRHGPMSFLRPDTLVISILSSDPLTRRYEEDLLSELRAKKLGRVIGIASGEPRQDLFDEAVPAMARALPDKLRTPFEIVFPQLLAYHLSLRAGLDPDNPSPGGVINRVVQGVRVYED